MAPRKQLRTISKKASQKNKERKFTFFAKYPSHSSLNGGYFKGLENCIDEEKQIIKNIIRNKQSDLLAKEFLEQDVWLLLEVIDSVNEEAKQEISIDLDSYLAGEISIKFFSNSSDIDLPVFSSEYKAVIDNLYQTYFEKLIKDACKVPYKAEEDSVNTYADAQYQLALICFADIDRLTQINPHITYPYSLLGRMDNKNYDYRGFMWLNEACRHGHDEALMYTKKLYKENGNSKLSFYLKFYLHQNPDDFQFLREQTLSPAM